MERGVSHLLREYVAGAAIAFGLVLFAREAFISYFARTGAVIEAFNRDLLGLSTILHLAGGFLGGHLVSVRREEETLRAGATTALFAYVLEFIVDVLFTGKFVNGLWVAAAYLAGGGLGAIYSNYKRRGRILEPRRRKSEASKGVQEKPPNRDRIRVLIEGFEAILLSRGYDRARV